MQQWICAKKPVMKPPNASGILKRFAFKAQTLLQAFSFLLSSLPNLYSPPVSQLQSQLLGLAKALNANPPQSWLHTAQSESQACFA